MAKKVVYLCNVMNYSPGLTIVIPVRDRAGLVGRTLESVAAQTLRPLKIVLVDNGSIDGTPVVLRNWAGEFNTVGIEAVVVNEPTPGASCARNRGLAEVTTEWTMFFDSDDTMQPDHCRRAMDWAEGADVVGWDVYYHDLDGRVSVKPFYASDLQYHSLMHGTMATQRYMARTSLFIRAGKWHPQMRGWDDIELGSRVLALSPRVRRIEGKPLVDIWAQEASITGKTYSERADQYLEALECIEANIGGSRGRIFTDVKRAILAADCRREGMVAFGPMLGERLKGYGLKNSVLLRMIYLYRLMGGRGAARIVRKLL